MKKLNHLDSEAKLELLLGLLSGICFVSGYFGGNPFVCVASAACILLLIRRWNLRLAAGKGKTATPSQNAPASSQQAPRKRRRQTTKKPKTREGLMDQMIQQGRYALLLKKEMSSRVQPQQLQNARQLLDDEMVSVKSGRIAMGLPHLESGASAGPSGDVEDIYVDRFAVTNEDYQQFVDAGGYLTDEHWCPEACDAKPMFVDSTGEPGPRFWSGGAYPQGQGSMPVVGVSWYEAQAYARWVGKRLPNSPEWVKAAQAPHIATTAAMQLSKFPWGNSIDANIANLWQSGIGKTVAVDDYSSGAVHGIYQLIGNVWEWNDDELETWSSQDGWENVDMLRTIRGGAFDTYLESQATCQSQSGDDPFARQHNIGFRCVVDKATLSVSDAV